jgi:hypothetical protein
MDRVRRRIACLLRRIRICIALTQDFLVWSRRVSDPSTFALRRCSPSAWATMCHVRHACMRLCASLALAVVAVLASWVACSRSCCNDASQAR